LPPALQPTPGEVLQVGSKKHLFTPSHLSGDTAEVVAVPRGASSDAASSQPKTSRHECADKLVFMAAQAHGDVASYSSTAVRKALKTRDLEFVGRAISDGASNLLFHPNPEELQHFRSEYNKLGLLDFVENSDSRPGG